MTDHVPRIDIDDMPICFCCAGVLNPPVPKSLVIRLDIPSNKNNLHKPEDLLHYICESHTTMNPGKEMWRTIAEMGI